MSPTLDKFYWLLATHKADCYPSVIVEAHKATSLMFV